MVFHLRGNSSTRSLSFARSGWFAAGIRGESLDPARDTFEANDPEPCRRIKEQAKRFEP